jgi:dihydroorotate oxidase
MVDTKVSLSGLILDNPVIPASGTFGFGQEYKDFYDVNILGSISIKGTTVDYRFGNETPRIAECTSGLINSVGLQNPGVDKVVSEELPNLAKIYNKKIIANISGFSIEEYVECAKKMDVVENVGIIEVNVSCPNVHNGGMAYGVSAQSVSEVTKAVKDVTKKPVYIKLSPNVTDIVDIAKACESSGADGLSLINTLLGMRIDIRRRAPIIANKMGGFSGPAIFPVALRMVYQVANAVKIPVIGMGGVSSAQDVIEMMMAGASAVQVGSANLVNPFVCKEIIEELPLTMEELGIKSLREIIGIVK